ncbi:MAG TPA: hypothetical protein PLU72_12505 [Candidatus Ozemobacteraceae bacterium]|nr:hypothetical protein [Candidatus Ozemobacteraceae bacterium]
MKSNFSSYISMTILILALAGVSPLAAQDQTGTEALLNTTVAIPASCPIVVRWVQPPMSHTAAEDARLRIPEMRFSVDANGRPWIGFDDRRIVSPANGFRAKTSTPFTGFVHLDNGAMIVSTVTKFGFLTAPAPTADTTADLPVVPFQAIAQLPALYGRLFAGAGDTLFIAVSRPGGKNELYRIKKGGLTKGFEKILEIEGEIAGVAGTDSQVFVAAGRRVYEVVPGTGQATPLPALVPHPITGVALHPRKGLLVSTTRGVGYLAGDTFQVLIETSLPMICMRGGSLYVFFPASLGVAAFDNIATLADLHP